MVTLLTVIYVICAVFLSCYAFGATILLLAYWRHRHEHIETPSIDTWPTVAVQLPIYNERYVVERLLQAVANLNYPRHLLTVQVLDDSTDETVELTARCVEKLRAEGLNIHHVRRPDRKGYKAGALAYGMTLLEGVEYVAVLDADFVPPPNFLRDTVPHMVVNPRLGMVQGRWGHLNHEGNVLTRGQAMALDGHFVVEQTGRNRAGWLINFNGSGGVWRVSAIQDAGGWTDETLTEDLDLSYRAQLKGWRFLYLPEIVVPGELPPEISAYKQQQARWAKGGTQCMVMLLGPVWRSKRLTLTQRLMATMHLCQYLNQPMMVMLLLLTPPILILTRMENLPLAPLSISGLGPPLVYVFSQRALYSDWSRRFLIFPALMAMGTGLAWNNTRAVISGLVTKKGEFKRTPKYAVMAGKRNRYSLRGDSTILIEIMLSLYALGGALLALVYMPPLMPYLVIYALSFGFVALRGISETLRTARDTGAWHGVAH